MKVRFDQHFLADRSAIEAIADSVSVSHRRVLEVGPGRGVLTQALLDRGATVIAIEIDPSLSSALEEFFSSEIEENRLILINGDAVTCPLPPFDIVVANLPYSASSPITFRLLQIGFEEAVLMYQLEFAEKMLTSPGTADASRLSVMVQTYAEATPLFPLSPRAFVPPPRVWSMVVRLIPRDPPLPIRDRKVYADLVRALFSQRRKKVKNCLKSAYGIFGRNRVDHLIASFDQDLLSARPENLTIPCFVDLANALTGE